MVKGGKKLKEKEEKWLKEEKTERERGKVVKGGKNWKKKRRSGSGRKSLAESYKHEVKLKEKVLKDMAEEMRINKQCMAH